MSKNVLIISSSPRRNGNSDTLCDQFLKGSQEAGHTVEKIFLKDKHIEHCTGCGVCFDRKKACSQRDDMVQILDQMVAADVIVMATPVYFYTMCGQMKTFIDRTCSRYTEITGKEFYFILTAADEGNGAMSRTIEEFRGFTSCLNNPKERGIIYGVGAWRVGEIKNSPAMLQAYEIGKKV